MSRSPTLRGRVSLLGLAVIGGWLFVLAAGFDIVLSVRLDRQIDDALVVRAQAASATIDISDGTITGVRESATDAALDNSIWIYRGETALERPRAPRALQQAADSLVSATSSFADRSSHRLHILPLTSGGRRIGAVIAAVDLRPYNRTRDTAIIGSIVVVALLLGGVYVALRYVAGRALRPVGAMAREAADYSAALPIRRFGEGQRYAELTQLAGNFDELLGRLATSVRHERHLSAELSHELRTPLARMIVQIELMTPSAPDDLAADLAGIRRSCEDMGRIIDSLLAAARTELSAAPGHAELSETFAQVRANLAALHPARGDLVLRVAQTDARVGVDPDIVVRTLMPILENAHRYAHTTIAIGAESHRGEVVVRIGNDGPPIPPEERERIFSPGVRDDTTPHPGAGLGLALAQRLARSADGDVTVDPLAQWTTFVVTLPRG